MQILRQVGFNIRRLRLERGLSQEELAFNADIARNYLSEIERGVSNPSVLLLNKLARVLKVSLVDIVAVKSEPQVPLKNLPRGRHVRHVVRKIRRR